MKNIKFIRHGRPVCQYFDYSKLTFEQICDLATDRYSPDIDSSNKELLLTKFNIHELNKIDLIITSSSARTKQTALLIEKVTGRNINTIELENLKEIYFDPEKLTTEDSYLKLGLPIIRKTLFKAMKKGKGSESLVDVLSRIKQLESFLNKREETNILCITHSFFMRLLRIYFLENIDKTRLISINKMTNTIDHTYLEGFDINL